MTTGTLISQEPSRDEGTTGKGIGRDEGTTTEKRVSGRKGRGHRQCRAAPVQPGRLPRTAFAPLLLLLPLLVLMIQPAGGVAAVAVELSELGIVLTVLTAVVAELTALRHPTLATRMRAFLLVRHAGLPLE